MMEQISDGSLADLVKYVIRPNMDGTQENRLVKQLALDLRDTRQALAEALARENVLRVALKWTMGQFIDAVGSLRSDDNDRPPKHYCEFDHTPDKGGCQFHDKWSDLVSLTQTPAAQEATK